MKVSWNKNPNSIKVSPQLRDTGIPGTIKQGNKMTRRNWDHPNNSRGISYRKRNGKDEKKKKSDFLIAAKEIPRKCLFSNFVLNVEFIGTKGNERSCSEKGIKGTGGEMLAVIHKDKW